MEATGKEAVSNTATAPMMLRKRIILYPSWDAFLALFCLLVSDLVGYQPSECMSSVILSVSAFCPVLQGVALAFFCQ